MNKKYWDEIILIDKVLDKYKDDENFISMKDEIIDTLEKLGLFTNKNTVEEKVVIVESIVAGLISYIIDMRKKVKVSNNEL